MKHHMMVMVSAAEYRRRLERWNLTLFARVFGQLVDVAGGPCRDVMAIGGQLGARGPGLMLAQPLAGAAVSHILVRDGDEPFYRYEVGRALERFDRGGVFIYRIGIELAESLARVSVGIVGNRDPFLVLPMPAKPVDRLQFVARHPECPTAS